MYQRELDNRLKNSLIKALLLFGENEYLIENYIRYYINLLNAKDELLSLYFDEWDFAKAKSYLSGSSLFGGTNLLIIKNDKKIPKKELDTLVALANKSSDNYLLFIFMGSSKDAKSLQGSFSKKNGGEWVRFFEPNIRDSVNILQQKATQIGLDIDYYALQHLILVLNNNLALCANELDKLAILGIKISGKDIDRLVYSTAPLIIEQFLSELFEKRPITGMISRLLELGEDEYSILRSTQRFVMEIFLFNAYIKLHGHPNSIEILGYRLPKQIEDKKANLAIKVKPASLLAICEHLLESELQIKESSKVNRETLLYATFIKIQRYL
jgi:DNA polymerase-3 subunit delta